MLTAPVTDRPVDAPHSHPARSSSSSPESDFHALGEESVPRAGRSQPEAPSRRPRWPRPVLTRTQGGDRMSHDPTDLPTDLIRLTFLIDPARRAAVETYLADLGLD